MNFSAAEGKLAKIKQEIFDCNRCPLYQTRNRPVVGQGNPQAKIIFIGEAPGFNEDKTGQPFCGASGKIFDQLLASISLTRQQIYITNILKCRPSNNRDPQSDEIKACTPYLDRQIEIINPKIICPLGRHSMKFIMEKFGLQNQIDRISKIHGKLFKAENLFRSVTIIPFYHPAVATYNPNMQTTLIKDFQVLN